MKNKQRRGAMSVQSERNDCNTVTKKYSSVLGVMFSLSHLLVLHLLGIGAQALPGQAASQEVHENVSQRLQVVAAALLDAQVVVDGRVARRTREVLVLAVHDVHVRLGVAAGKGGDNKGWKRERNKRRLLC